MSTWTWTRVEIDFPSQFVTLHKIRTVLEEHYRTTTQRHIRPVVYGPAGLRDLFAGAGPGWASGLVFSESGFLQSQAVWIDRPDMPQGRVVVLLPPGDPVVRSMTKAEMVDWIAGLTP